MVDHVGRVNQDMDGAPPQLRTSPPPPRAPRTAPSPDFGSLETKIIARLDRRVHFIDYAFGTVAAGAQLRPQELRYYLFVMNTAAAGNLILSYSGQPDAAGLQGQVLGPGGFYEPEWVPDNAINVIGSAIGVTGYIIVASQLADS